MAESKRTFQAARMDKDIDDRLLKPGQYRDGLNISIDTSEDANVGAVENLKGNELIANQNIYGLSSASNPNAKVVGSYPHPEEEKIYYFVTGDTADGIFEYDITNNQINTIVIDSLNLSTSGETELTFANASPSASITQDGTIFVNSGIGQPQVITAKFAPNTTGSAVNKNVSINIEVPNAYKNSNDSVTGSVTASQPTVTAPEVITEEIKTVANTTATIAGSLTNNSVNVTAQGFYYGYKTDGSVLTLSELKNGGTGITNNTVSSSSIKNNFTANITGLVADKQISYAAFATNSIGTTDGAVKSFTTTNTAFSITSLGFVNSNIVNTGGVESFSVSGTPGATYTLTGSVGATAPAGTHTIDGSGTATHNITISAQGTGDPLRFPRVDVATAGSTVFLPSNLQAFDTIEQAAGAAQTYNYSLTPSASIGNSTLKQTALSTGSTYTGFTTTQAAGYSATETFYIFPNAGYEFANTSSVSITGLPSWASASVSQNTNGDNHTYIQVDIAISNTPTNNDSATYNISATPTQVVTTWSAGLWTASTNPSAAISPTSDSSISFTGTGTKTASDTITVTDSSKYISSVNSTTKNATYGGNLITVSYSGIPTSAGGSLTVSFSIAIPADQRKSITYSSAPVAISLAGATAANNHTLTFNSVGSNFVAGVGASLLTSYTWSIAPGSVQQISVNVQPNDGYKLTNANDSSATNLPSWVTLVSETVTDSGIYSFITYVFNITGQSSTVNGSIDFNVSPPSPEPATMTWSNKLAVADAGSYTGSTSVIDDGTSYVHTGPTGSKDVKFTYSGLAPSSVVYSEPYSQTGTFASSLSNGGITIYPTNHPINPSQIWCTILIDNNYNNDVTTSSNFAPVRLTLND